jgi:hypothetical protein
MKEETILSTLSLPITWLMEITSVKPQDNTAIFLFSDLIIFPFKTHGSLDLSSWMITCSFLTILHILRDNKIS